MPAFLVVYERYGSLSEAEFWKPLLQHQALLAIARAILTDEYSSAPELSRHTLLVPRDLDVLPLLAMTARDFASFAEPEGTERGRVPMLMYEDGQPDFESADMTEMRHLLHLGWFQDLRLTLTQVAEYHPPDVYVLVGDPSRTARHLPAATGRTSKVVYFEDLATEDLDFLVERFPQAIAADRILRAAIGEASERPREGVSSVWTSMLSEGEAVQLEPFVAFGPALEMAVLMDDDRPLGPLIGPAAQPTDRRKSDGAGFVLWNEKLASYSAPLDRAIFDATFLGRWGNEEWKPDNADKQAAAELHVQLISRITTQRLGYSDGDEATALNSIYQLFDRAREIVARNATCQHVDALTWHVMNIHVRPFTAKWHPLSKRGALDALDATDIFRTELGAVQAILVRFDDLLLDIRDNKASTRPQVDAVDAKQAAIAEEMKKELKWGIPETLGGLDKDTAKKISDAERKSVSERRQHYRVNVNSTHAIGLALSGGGIRSATFSLGVLAALARRNILCQVDYLSTVSGGGYLGSFLTTFLNFQSSASTDEPAPQGGNDQSDTVATDPNASTSADVAGADGDAAVEADAGLAPSVQQCVETPNPTSAQLTAPPADAAPEIGLRNSELPFRRHEGEAQALRHIRHYSKYLASGSVMQRINMTSAMLYGMLLNLLGLVLVAAIFALLELGVRSVPGIDFILYIFTIITSGLLVFIWIAIPLWLRLDRSVQETADSFIAWPAIALIALLAWQLLGYFHLMYSGSTSVMVGSYRVTGLALIIASAAVPLGASASVGLFGQLSTPLRLVLTVIASVAAPLFFSATELVAYDWFAHCSAPQLIITIIPLALVALIFFFCLDINFTSPHRHYRKKLGEAYLIQPNDNPSRSKPFSTDVSVLLSQATKGKRGPYHLINCALNVPGSRNQAMQGRLTDFFLFSPAYCGSPIIGYGPTTTWEGLDKHLDIGTAMAISGGAVAPQMGLSTVGRLRFWLVILNARLSYWLRNPNKQTRLAYAPGLYHLLLEMFGAMDENDHFLNVSDGGHIENLGVYELLRRRCKYIIAVDGEQDPTMTFHALTTLQRLAFIDLGVKIDIDLDDLRLNARGLTRSHFCFCRIRYPVSSRDGPQQYGYLIYLKLSLTGNEGEFIRRYRLDEPAFPHHPTTDQFFTEPQFEAYRSLGEHVGDKLFLPAIVGDLAECPKVENWFEAIGKSMLEPIHSP